MGMLPWTANAKGGAVMRSIGCMVSALLGAIDAVTRPAHRRLPDTSGRWRMTLWTPAEGGVS